MTNFDKGDDEASSILTLEYLNDQLNVTYNAEQWTMLIDFVRIINGVPSNLRLMVDTSGRIYDSLNNMYGYIDNYFDTLDAVVTSW